MLVYRLQDQDNYGPWSSTKINLSDIIEYLPWYNDWVNQGNPNHHRNMKSVTGFNKFCNIVAIHSDYLALRYGATSQEELVYWFGAKKFLQALENWNVSIYFVPNQFVLVGNQQCCFDSSRAEMVACLSPMSMLNTEYDKFLDRKQF